MNNNLSNNSSNRQIRVGEMLRHTIADLLERHTLMYDDLRGVSIIVTEVDSSPDLKNAKVYVTRLGGGNMDSVIEGLTRVKSFIRREIAKKISLRHTPDLRFVEDNTFKEVDHINELLKRPEVLKDLRKK